MARQPFLPVHAATPYSVGYTTLEEKPEFAQIIGQIVGLWSYVEQQMGELLGVLLDTPSEATLEVFLTLRRSSSQREALAAAANIVLVGDDLLVFRALLIVYRSLEAQRNDIVHGCYGRSDRLPDCILWIELKHHVHFQVEALAKELKGDPIPEDRHARLKEHMFVYKMDDMTGLFAQIKELWLAAFHLVGYLRRRGSSMGSASYQQLCILPQIKHEISRLKYLRENQP